jgi:hypothetical protein
MEKRCFEPNTIVYKLTGLDNGNVLFELDEDKSDIVWEIIKHLQSQNLYKFERSGDIDDVLKEVTKNLKKAGARIKGEWDTTDVGTDNVLASLKISFPLLLGFKKPGNSKTTRPTLTPEEIKKYQFVEELDKKYIQ